MVGLKLLGMQFTVYIGQIMAPWMWVFVCIKNMKIHRFFAIIGQENMRGKLCHLLSPAKEDTHFCTEIFFFHLINTLITCFYSFLYHAGAWITEKCSCWNLRHSTNMALIGWRHSHRPTSSHVRKSSLTNMDLIWILLSNPGSRFSHAVYAHPILYQVWQ